MTCIQCGECCRNNGLIPPLVPGEDAPEWLWRIVNMLRMEFGATGEAYPCVFLTDDMRCSIYTIGKPDVCTQFACSVDFPTADVCRQPTPERSD